MGVPLGCALGPILLFNGVLLGTIINPKVFVTYVWWAFYKHTVIHHCWVGVLSKDKIMFTPSCQSNQKSKFNVIKT